MKAFLFTAASRLLIDVAARTALRFLGCATPVESVPPAQDGMISGGAWTRSPAASGNALASRMPENSGHAEIADITGSREASIKVLLSRRPCPLQAGSRLPGRTG